MNKRSFYFTILLIACMLNACIHTPDTRLLRHPSTMQFKPLAFNYPKPERIVLRNGMIVYLLEDHELPLIEMTAAVRVGPQYDPPALAGLASIAGQVMRTGGTAHHAPQYIDETLEFMAADISMSLESDPGTATLSVLKNDFAAAFTLFSELLREPAFNAERIALAQEQKTASLRRINDNLQNLAFREFKKLLYHNNPRGNLPTVSSISRIKRDDLITFHQTFFQPDRILLAVSGDFNRSEMLAQIEKRFADWKPSSAAIPQIRPPQPVERLSINQLQRDIPQSTIIIGQLAPQKSSPDYAAFEVLNFILGGGGFTSRLTSEIRSTKGLAYSVGSFYRGDIDYGVFGAYAMTKSSSTHDVLSLMLNIINSMKHREVQTELAWAQQSLINSFIFSFSSSAQIVTQQMLLEYERLPADFLNTFPDRIRAITLKDLSRVAQTYVHPDQSIILVVGNKLGFDKPLTDFGSVTAIVSNVQN